MTSDLGKIAEEMESRCNKNPPIHKVGCACSWAAVLRAWIAANKESPQRKAFVETSDTLVGILICFEDKTVEMYGDAARDVFKTYRAFKESERP